MLLIFIFQVYAISKIFQSFKKKKDFQKLKAEENNKNLIFTNS